MSNRIPIFIALLLVPFFFQCGSTSKPGASDGLDSHGKPKKVVHNFLLDIDSLSEYKDLMGEPLSSKFSNVLSVKVVYDFKKGKTYFINSSFYQYHFDFATTVLQYNESLFTFNARNYSEDRQERDYLLGNVNYIPQTSDFFLELSPSDWMDLNSIHDLYNAINKQLHITDTLFFYANTPRLMQAHDEGLLHIPVMTTERIFGTIQYQPIFAAKTRGILKKYKVEDLDSLVPNPNEIIILDQTPLVLPRVKGVIVNELQTPLSHLVLLGRNRNIPIAAQKNIWNSPRLQYFLDKAVEFEVLKDSFSLKLIYDPIDVDQQSKVVNLDMDTTLKEIMDLSVIPEYGIEKVGSKAFHYSLLNQIALKKKSFKVPEVGLAIPYFFYWEHFIKSGAEALLSKLSTESNPQKEKEVLKKMRKLIKDYPVSRNLVEAIETKLKTQSKFKAFRFRSSTNAEDLPEFNGAGLYTSETAILGDKKETIERAIKKVWASTWSERAYYERKYFGINQKTIAMGVLIHRSFPEEEANGVVVTKNIYRNTGGITVNVQIGENSVVMPKPGEITEIFTVYEYQQAAWKGKVIIDYVSFSILNKYQPIMSEKEIQNLYQAVKDIKIEILTNKNLYAGVNEKYSPGKNCEFDLEFKLMGKNRDLYIKQVRVYK